MLKYMIVPLCDTAPSFCHYANTSDKPRLIELSTLKEALLWSMKENLNIQFVMPDYCLPQDYEQLIDTVDNVKIASSESWYAPKADVVVFNECVGIAEYEFKKNVAYVIRADFASLQENVGELCDALPKLMRLNVVLTDADQMGDKRVQAYSEFLDKISAVVKAEYVANHQVQINLITDRLMLDSMNNCNAGWESITLAPNGKFYVCPAFYIGDETDSVGSLSDGIDIKNPQLYRLDYAPICRNCDAWHCRRCVWLNRRTTLEVNTPSHEQCVASHVERNATARLLTNLKTEGNIIGQATIDLTETATLDPFYKLLDN